MNRNKIKKINMLVLVPMLFSLFPSKIANADTSYHITMIGNTAYSGWYNEDASCWVNVSNDGRNKLDILYTQINNNNKVYGENVMNNYYATESEYVDYEAHGTLSSNTAISADVKHRRVVLIDRQAPEFTDLSITTSDNLYIKGPIYFNAKTEDPGQNKNLTKPEDISVSGIKKIGVTGDVNEIFENTDYKTVTFDTSYYDHWEGWTPADSIHNINIYSNTFSVENKKLFDGTESDGRKAVWFYVYDYAGNVTTEGKYIYLDNNGPTDCEATPSTSNFSKKINLKAFDKYSAVKNFQVYKNNSWQDISDIHWANVNRNEDETMIDGNATATYEYTDEELKNNSGVFKFRAVDYVGNYSDEFSCKVDKTDNTDPTIEIAQTPTEWTNQNVKLTIKATDEVPTGSYEYASGIAKIYRYLGLFNEPEYLFQTETEGISSKSVDYTVTNNGKYTFAAEDIATNFKAKTITVSNIDKIAPNISLSKTPTYTTNGKVTINITTSDPADPNNDNKCSGVKKVQIYKNGWVDLLNNSSYTVCNNGTYKFRVLDNAGNSKESSITINNINKVVTGDGDIYETPTTWTNKDVTIHYQIDTDSPKGIKRIETPDGNIYYNYSYYESVDNEGITITDKTAAVAKTFKVSKNGQYNVKGIFYNGDLATPSISDGSSKTLSINVTNIDKTKPEVTLSQNPTDWTNGNVDITVNAKDIQDSNNYYGVSGIKQKEVLENGSWKTLNGNSYTVTKNGTYKFRALDNAGNYSNVESINITNIDKTKPKVTLSQNPTDWTNGNVTINVSATDIQDSNNYYGVSGIKQKEVLENGSWKTLSGNSYTVTKNGTYKFRALDNAGNYSEEASIYIKNIDKNKPEVTGAEDYIQDPTKEEAGSSKTINITVTEPKDYLEIYSGLKYAKLFETTDGKDILIVNKESNGAKELEISYKNDKEGKRSFRLETEDRAGNKVIKEFENDIKPKNEIISLANTYRVYSLNCIDKNTNFGPRNPSLDILTGVYGEMEVTVKGSMLLDAEFYKGNQKINGMIFAADNMVNYNGVPSKMPLNLQGGDNTADNKISIKMQDPYLYPYQTQTVKFKFILPNIGTNNVEKDMPISIKLVSYNNISCVINNTLGKNFFIVKGDARADLNINNIR